MEKKILWKNGFVFCKDPNYWDDEKAVNDGSKGSVYLYIPKMCAKQPISFPFICTLAMISECVPICFESASSFSLHTSLSNSHAKRRKTQRQKHSCVVYFECKYGAVSAFWFYFSE